MTSANAKEEFENLAAFRPNHAGRCEVCDQSPTVSATGLCGPCTWGESDTMGGAWWEDEDERRYQKLLATLKGTTAMSTQGSEYKTGVVKWYDGTNKGFGFIVPDEGGKDVFLHSKALLRSNIPSVKEGDRLRYRTEQSDKGFKATDVEVIR